MERARLLQRLAQTERHVAEGKRHPARQEALIAELDQDGHDITDALASSELYGKLRPFIFRTATAF